MENPNGLRVWTTLTRQVDGEDYPFEVSVEYEVSHYTSGSRAVMFGNYPQPAEGSEFEFTITSIELDLSKFDPPTQPLTPVEKAQITAWFEGDGRVLAEERASDSLNDGIDDYEYDRWKEERMERGYL